MAVWQEESVCVCVGVCVWEGERQRETHNDMSEKQSNNGNEEYQRTCEACKRRYIMTFNAREKSSHYFFMQANIGISQYCLSNYHV